MKRVVITLLSVALIGLMSTSAFASEPQGQVSQDALSAVGLGQMQVMTDEEAHEVRGMGASAWGFSFSFNTVLGYSIAGSAYTADGDSGAGGDTFSSAGPFFFTTFAFGNSNASSN